MAELDVYMDSLAGDFPLVQASGCNDCAELKREQLLTLGWSEKAMRIAYSVTGEGRVERVLVITTDRGDVVLGAEVDMPAERLPAAASRGEASAIPAFIDL
jgi:predicted transglutaminase-like cysteine proteinase